MNISKRAVTIVAAIMLIVLCLPTSDQAKQSKSRKVWLRLKSGPVLSGDLVRMDTESVDFTVKGILQSVPCDDLIGVMFIPPSPRPTPTPSSALTPTPTPKPVTTPITYIEKPEPMTATLRPRILYREKAQYTEKARRNKVDGTVILSVVFNASGYVTDERVVRGLPDGLTDQAIEAAKKIRFIPAMKNSEPVSVRGSLEFTFNLY